MIGDQAQKRNVFQAALEAFPRLNSYHIGSCLFHPGKMATQTPGWHDWRALQWAETPGSLEK